MAGEGSIRIKRVYDKPAKADGFRVLVDRIWPRGLTRANAAVDEWIREVAPSTELRRWFGHDPQRFAGFASRYRAELTGSEALSTIRERCRDHPVVTLLYGARDTEHNQAVVLLGILQEGDGGT